ncbi:MAG: retroviral-like aspartic protease family protein [Planctomycetes bacterium]|nr:retroviral-like aspartic protease family protein [Planctomycetota bacterium]
MYYKNMFQRLFSGMAVFFILTAGASAVAAEGPVTLPFETHASNGLIILNDVGIGAGEHFTFILDTGTNYTILRPESAVKAGLTNEKFNKTRIKLGNMEITDAGVAVISYKDVPEDKFKVVLPGEAGKEKEIKVDGYLGHNVLSAFVLDIDFAGKKVTFNKPGNESVKAPKETKPLEIPIEILNDKIGGGEIRVKASLIGVGEEGEGMNLLFDTGCKETAISTACAKRLAMPEEILAETQNGAVGVEMPGLQAGDCVIEPFTITVSSDVPVGKPLDGLLGIDFLSHYFVRIDYAGKKIFLWQLEEEEY